MRKEIKETLDSNPYLQDIINSKPWANDNMGLLANDVIKLIISLGATESEAYEYLEIE